MIYSLKCKNFYSFEKKNSLSFEVSQKSPQNDSYFLTPLGTKLSKFAVVIGANASGKSNLLKLLPFLQFMVVDSFNISPSSKIPLSPFLFSKSSKKPSEVSTTFEIGLKIYTYELILNQERILEEKLFEKTKSKKRITNKTLFQRTWDSKNKTYIYKTSNFKLPKNFKNSLRENASFLSTATRLNHEESKKITKYWERIKTLENLPKTLEYFYENRDVKEGVEKILKNFDIGLNGLEISKEKGEDMSVKTYRLFDKEKHLLPFQYESAGTKQLLVVLKSVLQVLQNGGIANLDELDTNLHPEMIFSLYGLFVSEKTNPKKAQMIFSLHSHRILNELDKHQIFLTEKNEKGVSSVWRLDEVENVRSDDNFYMKYISGAYGALPQTE